MKKIQLLFRQLMLIVADQIEVSEWKYKSGP